MTPLEKEISEEFTSFYISKNGTPAAMQIRDFLLQSITKVRQATIEECVGKINKFELKSETEQFQPVLDVIQDFWAEQIKPRLLSSLTEPRV